MASNLHREWWLPIQKSRGSGTTPYRRTIDLHASSWLGRRPDKLTAEDLATCLAATPLTGGPQKPTATVQRCRQLAKRPKAAVDGETEEKPVGLSPKTVRTST